MQNCFRQHPDVYGAELEDDEPEGAAPPQDAPAEQPSEQSAPVVEEAAPVSEEKSAAAEESAALAAVEADVLVPKAAHDAEEKTN